MPFSDATEYPRGIFHTRTLTNVAQEVGTGGVKVSHWFTVGGTGAAEIIFRRSGGGTEYFRLSVPADDPMVVVPRGFQATGGLEVLTAAAAGDVHLTIFYFDASGPA